MSCLDLTLIKLATLFFRRGGASTAAWVAFTSQTLFSAASAHNIYTCTLSGLSSEYMFDLFALNLVVQLVSAIISEYCVLLYAIAPLYGFYAHKETLMSVLNMARAGAGAAPAAARHSKGGTRVVG